MSEQDIDVFQKYQGAINWSEVHNAGIAGAWVKLCNGASAASPTGDVYIATGKVAGVNMGGYHYVTGATSAVTQAAKFASELNRLQAFGLPPMCDFEDKTLPTSVADRRSWLTSYFTALSSAVPALANAYMYSSGSWLAGYAAGGWTPDVPGLNVVIIDAEYGSNNGIEHARTHYTGPVAAHQYTSSGSVPGVPGLVDRDDVTTVLPALSTQEEDVPLTPADGQVVLTEFLNNPDFYNLMHRVYGAVNNTGVSALKDGTQEPNYLGRVNTMLSSVGGKVDGMIATEATILSDVVAGDTGIQSIFADTEFLKTALAGLPAAVASSVNDQDATAVAGALVPLLTPLLQGGLTAEQVTAAVGAALHGASGSFTVA